MSYCKFCLSLEPKNVHAIYHENHYGFPISNDNELFGRLILEINQAGLSWDTILKKEITFRHAYSCFNINKIARFTIEDEVDLLNNPGIIRNKLKVKAAIFNAQRVELLQQEFGSFSNWLDYHHPKSLQEWNKLFKKTFKFVGTEIVNEFLMSTGYLPGAHQEFCPVFEKVLKKQPKWLQE
jgi:DNA-3-methyladenine glycosylase I